MTKFAKVLNKISKQIYDRNLRRTKMDTDICGRPLVPGTEAYNYAERTGMIHYEDAQHSKLQQYSTIMKELNDDKTRKST